MPFEPQNPPFLTGTIDAEVFDTFLPAPQLTKIIPTAHPWRVQVQWSITGLNVGMINPAANWHVQVYLESLGPGLEARVGAQDVLYSTGLAIPPNTLSYDVPINVPGSFTAPPPPPGGTPLTPGAYKLVTVVTIDWTNPAGIVVPFAIAGYVEGPVLQFFP
jgi:hypothetical protein